MQACDLIEKNREISKFLRSTEWENAKITALAGDASSRRYFRVSNDGKSALVMDLPAASMPDEYKTATKLSNSDPNAFIAIAGELKRRGFSAPEIYKSDKKAGFILLEDFGQNMFTPFLRQNEESEELLYQSAIDVLAAIYRASFPQNLKYKNSEWQLPFYDNKALQAEADLLINWYAKQYATPLSQEAKQEWYDIWDKLYNDLNNQPSGLALRDFHADNLFWLQDRTAIARIGLIDFQDAIFAHPAYDLVSLLEDARRDVMPDMIDSLIERFCQKAGIYNIDDFRTAYAILGAQRNAKILGIFVRLAMRDGKKTYLDYLPRVEAHFRHDLSHPSLARLQNWIKTHIQKLLGDL